MIAVAGLDGKYIIFIIAVAFSTFFLTVLPLWEKYILVNRTQWLFVLYTSPYAYYLIGRFDRNTRALHMGLDII